MVVDLSPAGNTNMPRRDLNSAATCLLVAQGARPHRQTIRAPQTLQHAENRIFWDLGTLGLKNPEHR